MFVKNILVTRYGREWYLLQIEVCIFVDGDDLLTSGRTSRDKSIIDVLIFGNVHVMNHRTFKSSYAT
jgi:hypothetical protein